MFSQHTSLVTCIILPVAEGECISNISIMRLLLSHTCMNKIQILDRYHQLLDYQHCFERRGWPSDIRFLGQDSTIPTIPFPLGRQYPLSNLSKKRLKTFDDFNETYLYWQISSQLRSFRLSIHTYFEDHSPAFSQ